MTKFSESDKVSHPSPYYRLLIAIFFSLFLFVLVLHSSELLTYFGDNWLIAHHLQLHKIIFSLLFLSLAHLVNVIFKQIFLPRTGENKIPALLQNLLGVFIYSVSIAGICSFVLDFSMAGFWASTGMLGIVLGVALKSLILDTVMGLAFSVESEFKIGDFIIIHDRTTQSKDNIIGQVIETNWRSTHLVIDGKQITIPNSIMGTKVVTNLSRPNPESELESVFTIDFSIEPEHVIQVLTAGVKSTGNILGILEYPEPKVRVKGVSSLGVEYKVKYTIMPAQIGPSKARHFVVKSILEHLRQAGISLAYPKQDSYFSKMPSRHLDLNSMNDRTSILARVYLFQGLPNENLSHLASLMVLKRFSEGSTIIQQHNEGDTMYVLVEGLLYIYIDKDLDEQLIKVGQITPGMFFGEMSLLSGEKRAATIKASTNAVVYEITREHVHSILMKHPKIAEMLSMAVAEYRMFSFPSEFRNSEEELLQTQNVAKQIFIKMKSFFKLN